MPGLFGLIRINRDKCLDENSLQKPLDLMVKVLSHRSDYVLDTFLSVHGGFAIGRLSHPSGKKCSWPRPYEKVSQDSVSFIHGSFTKGSTDNIISEKLKECPTSIPQVLRSLEGYYNFLFVYNDFHSFILSADRKGSEPIFYLEQNGMLFFGPEVKALLAISNSRIELDSEAIPSLLASGHVMGNHTLISSIKRLAGGCYIQIESNSIELKSYWDFALGTKVGSHSEEDLREEFTELLKVSVRKCMGPPPKSAIFLSGGLDSRGILAGALIATEGEVIPLNTVCWGIDNNIPGSDVVIAQQIALELNLSHSFFERRTEDYSEGFLETNYLADGLSDVAAFHPYEFTIMKRIKEMGIDQVLRGDEAVGYYHRVYSLKEATAAVGIRPFRKLKLYEEILRPEYYKLWSDGSDAAIDKLEGSVMGMDPTDAKDYLYFSHRLQGYQNSCASYKRILFEHRNAFLDDSILEFLLRVPWHLRADRGLFRKAVLAMHPTLAAIPFANYSGLENWNHELTEQPEVRKFVLTQLDDKNSGIWKYFDKNSVAKLFNSISSFPVNPLSPSFRVRLRKNISNHIFSIFPRWAEKIRTNRFQCTIAAHEALLRFLVLKNWYDTFIGGRNNNRDFQI